MRDINLFFHVSPESRVVVTCDDDEKESSEVAS
jgi:hypothetical protein